MSNQLQITGGAKVRNLEGVITGTSGVLGSVPLGAANGVATLDSGGKVPVSQLPASVVTYLGTWNAATNTPTLTNGVGDAGDLYICNVAGTANFGAGPVTFAVGDWVLYGSGTWQKSSGQNGTVTSVAASINGNAIGLTGSPITTAGTLAFAFAGTSAQYINGAGNLVTFPSLSGYVPYTGATNDLDLGTHKLTLTDEQFNPSSAPSYSEGELWYDSTQKALAYYNDVTNNILHIGQEVQLKVHNNTGSTIAKGAPVYVTSTSSGYSYPNVALAKADTLTTANVIGLANQAIPNGTDGYITLSGLLTGANTGSFTVGDVLYLSPYSAGQLMNTMPPTGYAVRVGVVSYSNTPNGTIYINQSNAYSTAANIVGTIQISQGGTGATTAGGALTNLGAQAQLNGTGFVKASGTTITYDNSTYYLASNPSSYIALTALSATSPLIYNNITGAFSIQVGTSAQNGYLSSSDWTLFNNKQSAITLTTTGSSGAATFIGNTLNIPNYSSALGAYVPYTGATGNVNLGSNGLLSYKNTLTITGSSVGSYNIQSASSTDIAGAGYVSITSNAVTMLNICFNGGTNSANFSGALITGYRTYTLPNSDGTLALTSQLTGGTVTSVALSAPTGFSVTGSPVTSSGTLALAFATGYSLPTTASQSNWDSAYTNRITSLTTTGSSGAATLSSNVLNIPNYGLALSGYLPLTGGTLTGDLNVGTTTNYSKLIVTQTSSYLAFNITDGFNGQLKVYSYYNSTYGIIFKSANIADDTFLPMSLQASRVNINNGSLVVGGTNDYGYAFYTTGSGVFTGSLTTSYAISVNAGAVSQFDMPNLNGMLINSGGYGSTSTAQLSLLGGWGNNNTTNGFYISSNSTSGVGGPAPQLLIGTMQTNSTGTALSNNSAILAIKSSGNVGIGTTSPSTLFYVNGYTASNWITTINNTGTNGHTLYFGYNDGSTTRYGLYISGGAGAAADIDLAVANKFYVKGNGNVLINTTTDAGYKLDVNGTGRFTVTSGYNLILSKTTGAALLFSKTNATAQDWSINPSDDFTIYDITAGGTIPFRIAKSTGAATFSSSITAAQLLISSSVFAGGADTNAFASSGRNVVVVNGSSQSLFGLTVGTVNKAYLYHEGTNLYLQNIANGVMSFGTNDTERMRIKSTGIVNLSNVPTSTSGLVTGDIYKTVAGVLMIV